MLDEYRGSFFREFIANIQNKCYIDMIIESVDSYRISRIAFRLFIVLYRIYAVNFISIYLKSQLVYKNKIMRQNLFNFKFNWLLMIRRIS